MSNYSTGGLGLRRWSADYFNIIFWVNTSVFDFVLIYKSFIFWPSSAITLLIFCFIDSLTVSYDNKFFMISLSIFLSIYPLDLFLFSMHKLFMSSLRSFTVINEFYTDIFVNWLSFLFTKCLLAASFFFKIQSLQNLCIFFIQSIMYRAYSMYFLWI